MAETPEYFDNVTVGQYAMTGIPLKVYVGGQYLMITDPDDVENPLIGFGMLSNGEMIQFDYKQVEHLLVSGNVVDLETYKKAMEDDDKEEEGEEEEGEEEESEEEESEEGDEEESEEEESEEGEEEEEEGGANPFESVMPSLASLVEITKDVKKAREKALDAEEDAIKDKRKALDDEPITDGVINEADYETTMRRKYGANKDYTNVEVQDIHFQTDPKEFEDMMSALGKKFGAMTAREEIADAEYELKRFRKSIKYGDGKSLDPFVPGTYEAATSKLGDGPHKKARPKVSWNEKKYDQWIEDVASGGGADHAYDMAQNAKMEPGLINWVKKNRLGFGDVTPLERIQYDIEAMAESVNEAKEIPRSKIDIMGSKILGKIKIGTTFVTDGGDYTVTGFGPKSNAFQEFDAEKDGKPCKVKLTVMYGVKLEVTDDPRSRVYRKEEMLNSMIFESVNEMKMVHKGKDITKHVLAYMEKKITKSEFEKLTGLKKDKLKVNESVIADILIIADENNTYEAFTAELVNQKYLMPDELEDPKTKEWLEDTYAAVHESISLKSLAMEAMPDKYVGNDEIVYLKTKEDSKGANYNLYYKGHDIEKGGMRVGSEKELERFAKDYILSNQMYNKLKYEKPKSLPESINEVTVLKLDINKKNGLHTFFKNSMLQLARINFSWEEDKDEATITFRKNATKKSIEDFKKIVGRSKAVSINEAKTFKKGDKVSYKNDDGKTKSGYIIKKMTKTFRGKKNVQYLIGTAKTTDPRLGRFDTVSSVPGKEADKLKLENYMEGPPYEYDNISEPYSIKVGDMVQNTNPSCPHHGSQGMVKKVMSMPDDIGDLIKYVVMNQGDTYQAGDVLTKTPDQLEVM